MWWRPFVFIWYIVYTFIDLPKYKKGVINRLPNPHLVRKVVLHRFLCPFILSFIFNMAASGHFGFWLLQNSAAIFARVMGAFFFLNTPKSWNQVSKLTMLSVVTGAPDITQLVWLSCSVQNFKNICRRRTKLWGDIHSSIWHKASSVFNYRIHIDGLMQERRNSIANGKALARSDRYHQLCLVPIWLW